MIITLNLILLGNQENRLLCHYVYEKEKIDKSNDTENTKKMRKKKNEENRKNFEKSKEIKISKRIQADDILRIQYIDKEESEVYAQDIIDHASPVIMNGKNDNNGNNVKVFKNENNEINNNNHNIKIDDTTQSRYIDLTDEEVKEDVVSTNITDVVSTNITDIGSKNITVYGEIILKNRWNIDNQIGSKLYKKGKPGVKKPYLDLLVARELAVQGKKDGKGLHEGSFYYL
jgi:hypothetical protein